MDFDFSFGSFSYFIDWFGFSSASDGDNAVAERLRSAADN